MIRILLVMLCIIPVQIFASEIPSIEPNRGKRCDATAGNEPATVLSIVDGDTIHADVGGRDLTVRLLGIDTPETHYRGHSQGYWGERATERLKELLPPGTSVVLEKDVEVCDFFGRVIATIWSGAMDVNEILLEEGLAVNFCLFPNEKQCRRYSKAVAEAILQKRGFYSDPSFVLPYVWRRKLSNKVVNFYVGNLFDYKVYGRGDLHKVPTSERIFFHSSSEVNPPYLQVN